MVCVGPESRFEVLVQVPQSQFQTRVNYVKCAWGGRGTCQTGQETLRPPWRSRRLCVGPRCPPWPRASSSQPSPVRGRVGLGLGLGLAQQEPLGPPSGGLSLQARSQSQGEPSRPLLPDTRSPALHNTTRRPAADPTVVPRCKDSPPLAGGLAAPAGSPHPPCSRLPLAHHSQLPAHGLVSSTPPSTWQPAGHSAYQKEVPEGQTIAGPREWDPSWGLLYWGPQKAPGGSMACFSRAAPTDSCDSAAAPPQRRASLVCERPG